MIRSFRDKRAYRLWQGEFVPEFQGFTRPAIRRLELLNAAETLVVLRAFPSNHFEALKGDQQGRYSIRINRQWRIVFDWLPMDAAGSQDLLMLVGDSHNVEIVDYH